MIQTDGISCCILFKSKEKRVQKNTDELYLSELESPNTLQNSKIVAIDPNMGDLLYCVDGTESKSLNPRSTETFGTNSNKRCFKMVDVTEGGLLEGYREIL